jgi:hypothetical protein
MAALSINDLADLIAVKHQRDLMIVSDCIERNEDKVMQDIMRILNMDSIKERMKDVCSKYTNPWDLKIGIYGYNKNRKVEHGMGVRLNDVIDRDVFLFKLDNLFNGDRPYGRDRFRVSVRNMIGGQYGWREIMLNYYPAGVPTRLLRGDPEMPPLETGELPASPIPLDPEDDEESFHERGCSCEDCCHKYGYGEAYEPSDHGNCVCRDCRNR